MREFGLVINGGNRGKEEVADFNFLNGVLETRRY